MCTMGKEKIVSCQIGYIPIDSVKYLEEIDKVLQLIKNTDLEYNVDILSTTIRGESEKVLNLIAKIHNVMSDKNCKYTMNIILSNICGCE